MGFGSTAKKLQKVADIADDLYTKVNELKAQLQDLRGTVEATNSCVDEIDGRLDEQRALLEAIADEQGVDTEAVLTDALIEDAEGSTAESDAAAETGETEADAKSSDD
ncbi:DUF5798 family protein [Haloarcula nitratireducens]|uniref:Uncharacterized protein n=1 Tax=Haloarcula nitratireducens TaxID=2487749 RepID=A0AAW4P9N0_9EURY|nr:DUF5798 family protein [Halomicroarcula nitratireducens]MBX0294594.1 hypothetical protein [Halomicroarcula nitratireducens]